MNLQKFLLDYGLFAIILVGCMVLFPPALTPMLGATLGQYTSYVITAIVGIVALWVSRKTRKAVE